MTILAATPMEVLLLLATLKELPGWFLAMVDEGNR